MKKEEVIEVFAVALRLISEGKALIESVRLDSVAASLQTQFWKFVNALISYNIISTGSTENVLSTTYWSCQVFHQATFLLNYVLSSFYVFTI